MNDKPTFTETENKLSNACRWMFDFEAEDGASDDLRDVLNSASTETDAAQRIAARIVWEMEMAGATQ